MTRYHNKSEELQEAFFKDVLRQTHESMATVGKSSFYIDLAGVLIRIDFAGPALISDTTTALGHLAVDPGQRSVDAQILVWDSVSTGVGNVKPPLNKTDYSDRGDLWGFNSTRYLSAFHWSDYSLNLFDSEKKTGIFWVNDAGGLPYWSRAAPLRTLFHWIMQKFGCQLVHAAAIGDLETCLLITGRGGVGKSSTALSCLLSGMQYIGDDYLVLSRQPELRAWPLYATAKLGWPQFETFPVLERHLMAGAHRDDEKATILLHPHFASQIPRSLPVKLVVTPQFHDYKATVLATVSSEKLRGAATLTTVSQLPHGNAQTYSFIGDAVENHPGASLMLGTDRSAIPKATAAILESPTRDHSIREQEWNTAPNLPLVSIIIPVFNGAQFLSDAVENVRSQAYPAIELIVVDDGSTDAIEETINNLPLEVRLLRQSNRGPAAARNLGIKNATGDLLAFLDVDDLWPENNLYMLVRHLLENTQLQLVRGHAQIMQLEAHNNEYRLIGNPLESFPDYIGAALYRKSLFQAVGLFDQTRFFGEDSDWFERVDQSGEAMQTLDLVTLHVRRHGGNMTENKPLATMRKLQLVKKHLEARREPAS